MGIQIILTDDQATEYMSIKSGLDTNVKLNTLEFIMKGFEGLTPTNRLNLIKGIMNLMGWSLKEAKEYIDGKFPINI